MPLKGSGGVSRSDGQLEIGNLRERALKGLFPNATFRARDEPSERTYIRPRYVESSEHAFDQCRAGTREWIEQRLSGFEPSIFDCPPRNMRDELCWIFVKAVIQFGGFASGSRGESEEASIKARRRQARDDLPFLMRWRSHWRLSFDVSDR